MDLSPQDQPITNTLPAVILAAGRGERLHSQSVGGLKPLTPLLGLTLLERTLLSCQAVGVSDCYIVVGYGEYEMTSYITTLARRYRMRLHSVPNPHWAEGNGTSALAVEPYLKSAFLLMMCDHVFDAKILETLLAARQVHADCLLAVDHRVDEIFDLDDATKVQLNNLQITNIGKEIERFDSIDTGLFLCYPPLFSALRAAQANGDTSLSGGIQYLIAASQMRATPIGQRFWMDIDTPESLEHAERVMLETLMSADK